MLEEIYMASKNMVAIFLFASLLFVACSDTSSLSNDSVETGFEDKPKVEKKPSKEAIHIAGIVTDKEGKPVPRARLYLSDEFVNHHSIIKDSTIADSKGKFSFGYIDGDPKFKPFRILAKLPTKSGKSDSLMGYDIIYCGDNCENSLDFDIKMDAPAAMRLYFTYLNRWNGGIPPDSVCFSGARFVCDVFSDEEKKRGYAIITGIPSYGFRGHFAWLGDKTSDVGHTIELDAGDTLYVGDYAAGYPEDSLRIALPKSTTRMLDSLGLDKSLERLFIPVDNSKNYSCKAVVDELGNELLCNYAEKESNNRCWLTLYKIREDSIKAHWLSGGWISSFTWNDDIKSFYASVNPGDTVFKDTLFRRHHNVYCPDDYILYKTQDEGDPKDSCTVSDWQEETLALSFWIDSSKKPDSNRASNRTILSAGRDTLGFKMEECEEDPKSICISINARKDTAASGIYGKAKILDGKRHHVSFVVYKKHLCIIIDGVTIHDSDLEFYDEFFGSFAGIRVGSYPLSDIVFFQPGSYVHEQEDKNWGRLQAWFNAFYELQK